MRGRRSRRLQSKGACVFETAAPLWNWLQRELAKRGILKYTPQLHFHLDQSAERGTRIMAIIDELALPPAVDAYGEVDADEPALGVLTPTDAASDPAPEDTAETDPEDEAADDDAPEKPMRVPRRRNQRH